MPEENDFNMTEVSNSQIAAVGFNPTTSQGRVIFSDKGRGPTTYEYDNCTAEEFDSIVNAPSVGIAFGETWKGSKPYRRIS